MCRHDYWDREKIGIMGENGEINKKYKIIGAKMEHSIYNLKTSHQCYNKAIKQDSAQAKPASLPVWLRHSQGRWLLESCKGETFCLKRAVNQPYEPIKLKSRLGMAR